MRNLGKYAEEIEWYLILLLFAISYDQVLKLDPKDLNAWYNKGNALHYLENFWRQLNGI